MRAIADRDEAPDVGAVVVDQPFAELEDVHEPLDLTGYSLAPGGALWAAPASQTEQMVTDSLVTHRVNFWSVLRSYLDVSGD